MANLPNENASNSKSDNPLEHDAQIKQYFDTLPPFVQESVKQTGVKISSVEDLRKCAENMTRQNSSNQ